MGDATVALTEALIARPSVTPDDAGCQAMIAERLAAAGFTVHKLRFGEVDNLIAVLGEEGSALMFLGHTDVVPPGPREDWDSDPFTPVQRDGHLYGRGAADMKGAVAAMTVALEQMAPMMQGRSGRLMLLLTSDEEGPAQDGVRRVAPWLSENGLVPDYCVVGEPSSIERFGDLVRIGRRGSLHGRLRVNGVQGHVAYPDKASNPIHRLAPALAELVAERWDDGVVEDGKQVFPPTSFQISNLNAGTGADNVIPGRLEALINFRFCPASAPDDLRDRVEAVLQRHAVDFEIEWRLSGEPFLTSPGRLRDAAVAAVQSVCGIEPRADTGGGTSDGRFIAPLGSEVVELGLINASIHQVNENTCLDDLRQLPLLYVDVGRRLFGIGQD
ncbi:MAG: succinyl-diaminopimelate desuccinylase [Lysobacteraceae bacterium]